MNHDTVIVRYLGKQDYSTCWEAMKQFTNKRDENTFDELWLLEHPPVFTQGQNGKPEHLLNPGDIPVIKIDRGGQVTYHGPGQLVVYTLVDIQRKKMNIRELVTILEASIIQLLSELGIQATAKCEAPGVYINNQKIGSVGLRIRRGCSYHGLAFNIQMELEPFTRINPCGFAQLKMTQLSDHTQVQNIDEISLKLVNYLVKNLGYNNQLVKSVNE
jgi:lipoyl(octanoyl) transferase